MYFFCGEYFSSLYCVNVCQISSPMQSQKYGYFWFIFFPLSTLILAGCRYKAFYKFIHFFLWWKKGYKLICIYFFYMIFTFWIRERGLKLTDSSLFFVFFWGEYFSSLYSVNVWQIYPPMQQQKNHLSLKFPGLGLATGEMGSWVIQWQRDIEETDNKKKSSEFSLV